MPAGDAAGRLPPMMSWLGLITVAVCAGVSLASFRRHVLTHLGSLRHPALVLDVWLPVALVLPLLFLAGGLGGSVRGVGWAAVGGPVVLGVLGMAAGLLVGRGGLGVLGEEWCEGETIGWRLLPRCVAASITAGLALLLVAVADVLTIWIGQITFALAAVMLWINTPDDGAAATAGTDQPTAGQIRAGLGTVLMVLLAAAMGGGLILAQGAGRGLAVAIILGHAAFVLGLLARTMSHGIGLRVCVWAASLGALLGLGMYSLLALWPRVIAELTGGSGGGPAQIAYGFGAYALEATMLLVLAVVGILAGRLEREPRRLIGAIVLVLAVILVFWRLTEMLD